jgi:hypothetical protein
MDVAGNVSAPTSITFNYDTIAPGMLTVSLVNDTGPSNTDHVTSIAGLNFGSPTDIIEFSANGVTGWSSTVPTWVQGVNTFYYHQIDAAGNASAVNSFSFTYDNIAPTAPGPMWSIGGGGQGVLQGTGEAGANFMYSADGVSWSPTPLTLITGMNSVHIKQMDLAGNVSPENVFNFNYATVTTQTGGGSGATTGSDFVIQMNANTAGGGNNTFTTTSQYSLLSGAGGADILLGGNGDNLIGIPDNQFKLIDGGAGYDRFSMTTTGTMLNFDFTTGSMGQVQHIEEIDLGHYSNTTLGNHLKLNIQDVFDMTDGSSNHTLKILQAGTSVNSSLVTIVTSGANDFKLTSGTLGSAPTDLFYTGTWSGTSVTLIIHNGMNVTAAAGDVQVMTV